MIATNPAGMDTTTPVYISGRAAGEPGEPAMLRERSETVLRETPNRELPLFEP